MGNPSFFAGSFVKFLKTSLNLNGKAYILTGTNDPTSVATNAPSGSLFLRQNSPTGALFFKRDNGSSTNWTGPLLGGNTDLVPAVDNTYSVGTTALRWLSGHFGPTGVVVHNDNTNTNYVKMDFSAAVGQIVTDAATPLQMTTGANVGLYMKTDGTLGLGTITPGSTFEVKAGVAGITINQTTAGQTAFLKYQRNTVDKWETGVNNGGPGGTDGYYFFNYSTSAYAAGVDNTSNWFFVGNVNPSTDNTRTLGTTALRWASLHVGPGSITVHNDATNTLFMKLAFASTTAIINTDAATPLQIYTGSNTGIYMNTSGQVGINTQSPHSFFAAADAGGPNAVNDAQGTAAIFSANIAMSSNYGTLVIQTNDAQAADLGGSIAFGGRYQDAVTAGTHWAVIKSGKTSSVSASHAGYLSFGTRDTGAVTEWMRIINTGFVGIGTTSPGAQLEVKGANASGIIINQVAAGQTAFLKYQRNTVDKWEHGVNNGGPGGTDGFYFYNYTTNDYAAGIDNASNWTFKNRVSIVNGISSMGVLVKTTTYTAVAGDTIFANSTGGVFTITLPVTPTAGQRLIILDYAGTWATNNVTVSRNGQNINGLATDFTLNVNNAWAEFIFVDATQGWRVRS